MNCNCKGCKECIFYNANESKCMRRKLSTTAQEFLQSPILIEYIFTLKSAYKRYIDYACEVITERDKSYWRGRADGIFEIFNYLGFVYLLT